MLNLVREMVVKARRMQRDATYLRKLIRKFDADQRQELQEKLDIVELELADNNRKIVALLRDETGPEKNAAIYLTNSSAILLCDKDPRGWITFSLRKWRNDRPRSPRTYRQDRSDDVLADGPPV